MAGRDDVNNAGCAQSRRVHDEFGDALMRLERRPQGGLAAASCHTRAELERAMQLELDFAVLGPVLEKSGGTPLGWDGFAAIARGSTIPVYAVGGLTAAHLEHAWRAGAHGLAMIRASWR